MNAEQTPDDGEGSPNERLAARVASALDTAGLLPAGRADDVRARLAAGTLKEEDWRLLIERTIDEAARGEDDAR
jgi:hypothetical protein